MNDVFTIEEIKSRFASAWVLLEDPQTSESLEVIRGKVLWHSKDRDEVYRKARELRPRHSAIAFAGSIPDEMAVVV
jgi:hypothetical protein